jgi:hypothetical protein
MPCKESIFRPRRNSNKIYIIRQITDNKVNHDEDPKTSKLEKIYSPYVDENKVMNQEKLLNLQSPRMNDTIST